MTFNNLVNRQDALRLCRKLRRLEFAQTASKLGIRGKARVREHFAIADPSLEEWWAIPQVVERWNRFISGDPEVLFSEHVVRIHLAGRSDLHGLTLGCGTGGREVLWARHGVFSKLVGIDISPERIACANQEASRVGLSDVLAFQVADVRDIVKGDQRFDVVIGEQSLHHFTGLSQLMVQLRGLLNPGGLLVVDEFVGPTRFQWTDRQLDAANALLERLPEQRRRLSDGRIKRRVNRPSRLGMIFDDPSEAVEASALLPAIRRHFDVIEERPYGGTVLHIALSGIAQNFLDGSEETLRLLDMCFAAEDRALPSLGHDFMTMVCSV